jgi:hypothetical protein
MIFGVSFQRTVGNEPCYLTENTLIITVLSNRSRKRYFPVGSVFIKACARAYICIVKQELL